MSRKEKRSKILQSDAQLTIESTAKRVGRFINEEATELLEICRENTKNYDELTYMVSQCINHSQNDTAIDIAAQALIKLEKEIDKRKNHLMHEPFKTAISLDQLSFEDPQGNVFKVHTQDDQHERFQLHLNAETMDELLEAEKKMKEMGVPKFHHQDCTEPDHGAPVISLEDDSDDNYNERIAQKKHFD